MNKLNWHYYNSSTAYPFIKSPLLLIHATEPEELKEARKRGISQIKKDIPEASIIALGHSGHMVQWDQPEEVAKEVVSWVKSRENQ